MKFADKRATNIYLDHLSLRRWASHAARVQRHRHLDVHCPQVRTAARRHGSSSSNVHGLPLRAGVCRKVSLVMLMKDIALSGRLLIDPPIDNHLSTIHPSPSGGRALQVGDAEFLVQRSTVSYLRRELLRLPFLHCDAFTGRCR